MSIKPHRRFVLKLEIGGDTWRDVLGELNHRLFTLETEQPKYGPDKGWNGASGGPGSGSSTEVMVDHEMTHERYFEQIQKYLAEREQAEIKERQA